MLFGFPMQEREICRSGNASKQLQHLAVSLFASNNKNDTTDTAMLILDADYYHLNSMRVLHRRNFYHILVLKYLF